MDTFGILCIFCSFALSFSADLEESLQSYDVLHKDHIKVHHIHKRSADPDQTSNVKILEFTTSGRHFELRLSPVRGLFSPRFRAVSVDADNKRSAFSIDKNNFYDGIVTDTSGWSSVHAYFDHEDLVAKIQLEDDTYVIEPSKPHLPKSKNYTMISYKVSDMKQQKKTDQKHHLADTFCGFVRPDGFDEAAYHGQQNDVITDRGRTSKHNRHKRATPAKNTCNLLLVADYKFHNIVGDGSVEATANYLVNTVSNVDSIYRSTDFDGYTGTGFEIEEIIVHQSATPVSNGQTHYNMDQDAWNTRDLLTAFSRNSDLRNYCLGHLWTGNSFSDGVQGLGWIASPENNAAGGICSPSSGGVYYNTAWSAALNKNRERILTQESEIVTAHEFGHNWGSQHDPASSECAPSGFSGGKYIMYTYSVSGYESNNRIFSPCSKRSVGDVLAAKLNSCFKGKEQHYCGNLAVEPDFEQCDAGPQDSANPDPCCTTDCQFRSGAVCSDKNSPCCTGCAFSVNTTLCSNTDVDNTTCEENAFCSGASASCPAAASKPDGTNCIDDGKCFGGECRSFCEARGLFSCVCDNIADACKFCCKNSTAGRCEVYGESTGTPPVTLADAKPCARGYCQAGECVVQVQDLGERLWDVIITLDSDAIAEFFKKNLVLAVIVFSLLIYIPICIVVCIVDCARDRDDDKEREWHHKDNEKLLTDGMKPRVWQTYTRARKPELNTM